MGTFIPAHGMVPRNIAHSFSNNKIKLKHTRYAFLVVDTEPPDSVSISADMLFCIL